MDLFDGSKKTTREPLASRMRPRNLDEYIGQDHIVGKGRLLRRAIAADQLTSVIFYGPPGTGKTTLARVIANHTKSLFVTLNAVLTGVQNIRDAIKTADEQQKLYNKRTILFVDEVHRWNKSQQDALLPWVENGTLILVGATTENPFFEVNKALVSRSRVFPLHPLTKKDLKKAAFNAIKDTERGYGRWNVQFEEKALDHLIETANGDCRSLLNALELAIETTPKKWDPNGEECYPPEASTIFISCETAEQSIQKKVVLYDRDGDYHYDIISAFIKSIRGSDPDASMYWMARMISAGEDPHFIFRRMLISSCEDIGLADPNAIRVVESCAAAFDRIGLPEGRFMLTQAALYLATAPKSNSTLCFFDALEAVKTEDAEVPNPLKDKSRDSESLGHGKGYLYPHAYKDHWVAQQYLPTTLSGKVFYNPSNQGYEKTIQQTVLSKRELQIATLLERTKSTQYTSIPDSIFYHVSETGSKTNKLHATFKEQTESHRAKTLATIRETTLEEAQMEQHFRCLIYGADDALLLWEIWRICQTGLVAGICYDEKTFHVLEQYNSTLDSIERPIINMKSLPQELEQTPFERIFFTNPIIKKSDIKELNQTIENLYTSKNIISGSTIIISQLMRYKNQHLADLLLEGAPESQKIILQEFNSAEEKFYGDKTNDFFNWNTKTLTKEIAENFKKTTIKATESIIQEQRILYKNELERWFNAVSPYGNFIKEILGSKKFTECKDIIEKQSKKHSFTWNTTNALITISF